MPTGIEESALAAVSFIFSIPKEFLYFIFLGGLALDSFLTASIGFNVGAFGALLSFVISNTFGIPAFVITSFQMLVIFTIIPIIWFMLSHGRPR